jgi:hypothetical protein
MARGGLETADTRAFACADRPDPQCELIKTPTLLALSRCCRLKRSPRVTGKMPADTQRRRGLGREQGPSDHTKGENRPDASFWLSSLTARSKH